MLKAIHAQESRDAADRKARAIVDDLRAARMNTAADLVERSVSETLTYYAFPDIHWQKIRTNNPLERIMREIRRRTRVVGAFPDGQSCLNLAAARLRYIAGTAWSAADSDDCGQAIRLNAAKRSDRRRAPFPTKATGLHCRHGDLGQGFFAASRLEVWAVIFRMLSPVSTRRCALWTRRSRTASAMVGSAMTSCQ